jgi:large subunit ribosomal protein L20
MPRARGVVAHHARKKKIMEAGKGGRGARSKLYKATKENVERGMAYAYRDRKKKKGDFRRLWITRIGAAVRMHELSYSRFMAGLKAAGIEINRKVLSELAISDAAAFATIVEVAKAHQG